MRKAKSPCGQACPKALQAALDRLDVIGQWNWDAATDRVHVEAFVALLFHVDPDEAEYGVPLSHFIDNIHGDDRERVLSLIRGCALAGSTYLTEYRVISADGQTRWVLARGRFANDQEGRPMSGSGILVDITRMRMSEGTFDEVEADSGDTPLEWAADHIIAAQYAIIELQDPDLKLHADALLLALGRKLAQQEVQDRRKRIN